MAIRHSIRCELTLVNAPRAFLPTRACRPIDEDDLLGSKIVEAVIGPMVDEPCLLDGVQVADERVNGFTPQIFCKCRRGEGP